MIPKHMHLQFERLMQAAEEGTLALVESKDRHSGLAACGCCTCTCAPKARVRWVLASVSRADGTSAHVKGESDWLICPFGHLSESPMEDYADPAVGDDHD